MTGTRIGYAKPEIRVLGLAAAKVGVGYSIVGAVMRRVGRLEGVLWESSADADVTAAAAEMIKASRHFGQTRVIVVDVAALGGSVLDSGRLWGLLGKPVVEIRASEEPPFAGWGISTLSARRVLQASRKGQKVEAVRVASLVAAELEGKV